MTDEQVVERIGAIIDCLRAGKGYSFKVYDIQPDDIEALEEAIKRIKRPEVKIPKLLGIEIPIKYQVEDDQMQAYKDGFYDAVDRMRETCKVRIIK